MIASLWGSKIRRKLEFAKETSKKFVNWQKSITFVPI
jgi:hypothetical protein